MKTLLLLAAVFASAQTCHAHHGEPNGLHRPPFWYHHASTALEGALRGYAEYVSAHGEFFVNRAYAEQLAQQARRLAIQVEQERIAAYWRIRDEYKQRTYGNRVSAATIERINKARLPKRPAAHAAAASAEIHWPAVLQGEAFAPQRAALEEALALRAGCGHGPGSPAYRQAVAARDVMLERLRDRIGETSPMQYIQAKRLIESLAYETMFAPQAQLADN